jgi:hypothetical protein
MRIWSSEAKELKKSLAVLPFIYRNPGKHVEEKVSDKTSGKVRINIPWGQKILPASKSGKLSARVSQMPVYHSK